ncbi:HAD family hydrolase [Blastomonas sp.]|uniref:HAD family hydrolase n=1 Tax=Blastomonas sp. TaxID=1909299 RepID=UPI0035938302
MRNPKALLVTDCDEVLLHMVDPFRAWLDEVHAIDFDFSGGDFAKALVDRKTRAAVKPEDIWPLLNTFFDTEMARQQPIAGALAALSAIGEVADIVVLTNLMDHRQAARSAQLAAFGVHHRVVCNQGPKGEPLKRIVDEHGADVAIFIDDLPQHHESAATHAPDVWRLHMVGEAALAPHIACAATAGQAHARIDRWDAALPWIIERLAAGQPAPPISMATA